MDMAIEIIERKREINQLMEIHRSGRPEFVVVYGRRRVGKTFLVRELFAGKMALHHTALSPFELEQDNAELLYRQQLRVFGESLRTAGDYHKEAPEDWIEAFQWLREMLERKPRNRRQVVFIDELPWMDTPRSGFVTAFEHFWNGWGAGRKNLMLIVSGSATSWINDRLLNNTSGLYGRTTREIHLAPFSLGETDAFFKQNHIVYDHYDTIQAYMAVGGIPYYLSYFERGLSVGQNIDNLFFNHGGKLQLEFDRLFKSLFSDSERYTQLVRVIGKTRRGLTRKEICEGMGMSSGAAITKMLQALEAGDFIIKYKPIGGSSREVRYKLVDLFTLFYIFFIDRADNGDGFWQHNLHSATLNTWRGLAFENVCYVHVDKIKQALGIAGVHTEIAPWLSKIADCHAQIDMLIDRDDRVANVCEIKYYGSEFTIDKQYDLELRNKVDAYLTQSGRRRNPHLTIITTYGLRQNMYSGAVQSVVTGDQLF